MLFRNSFRNWIKDLRAALRGEKKRAGRGRTTRPQTEVLEDRVTPAVMYVDNPGDFSITTDQGAAGLDNGDTVTWNAGLGSEHSPSTVAGLTFGTNAFGTVQSAVTAATAGDTIRVAPGTFSELVNVNKQVFLFGNQVGDDARDGRPGDTESVIDATGLGGAFNVSANDVVIDGFTVQGQTGGFPGAGVWMQPGTAGTEVRNNIIQNNVAGIFVANNSAANQTVIERNLFRNNTNPGAASGHDIYADEFTAGTGMQNILIDSNTFTNTSTVVNSWALGVSNSTPATPFTNLTFSNNVVTNHGRGMYFFNTDGATVSGNEITGATNYAIGVFTIFGTDNNANIDILNNKLSNNNRGVWVDGYTGTLDVNSNDLSGNVTAGIQNDDADASINAENNWWGSPTGPTSPNNPGGTGAPVTGSSAVGIDFSPFLASGVDTDPGTPGFQPAASPTTGIAVQGTGGVDTLIVTATGPDSGSYSLNGGPAVPFTGITSFSFAGLGDNDLFQVNNPAGGLFAPVNGIFYDGGGQTGTPGDRLEILGGASTAQTHTFLPASGGNRGTIALVNGATTANYSYSGLEPVLVNAGTPNDIVFNLPTGDGNNNATLGDNALADGLSQISGTGFETTVFVNLTNSLTVNIGNDGETFTLAPLDPAFAATAINLNGGTAADILNVLATPASAITTVDTGGGAADAINVSSNGAALSGNLNALDGQLNINNGPGGSFSTLNISESGSAVADTVTVNTDGFGGSISGTSGGGWTVVMARVFTLAGGINVFLGSAGDTVSVRTTSGSEDIRVDGNGGADTITVGSLANSLDVIQSAVTVNAGGQAGDTLNVNDQGDATPNLYTVTSTQVTRSGGPTITYGGLGGPGALNLNAGTAGDIINVNSTAAGAVTSINAGGGNDSVVFANGVSLNGGTVDGGAGTADTINYAAYTTPVAVNLGSTVSSLQATMDGTQENPPNASTATATATITNYNPVTKTFDISGTVTGLTNTITDSHIHRGPVGTNGPVILPFGPGIFVPAGPGNYTFNLTGVTLDPRHEAAFLGGLTYFNIHTNAFLGGEIRGQIVPAALFTAGAGTATGTGGVSNVENVVGGSGTFTVGAAVFADSIVGDGNSNVLQGGPGNDVLVGARGDDTMQGGADNDFLVWSNGDGNDVMDGDGGTDTAVFNGAPAANDVSSVTANGTRVNFTRTSPAGFSLDIGTVETLSLNGYGGDDSFTVGSLPGVLDLTTIDLNGLDGNDTFDVTPSTTVTMNVRGHVPTGTLPGDQLTFQGSGTKTITGPGNGQITSAGNQPVNFVNVEQVQTGGAGQTLNDVVNLAAQPGGQDTQPNVITIQRDATGTLLQIFLDPDGPGVAPNTLLSTELYSSVSSVTINGGTDDDRLVIDHANGLVGGGDGSLDGGITFNGGAGTDSLAITGDPGFVSARETYVVGVTQDAGTWVIDPDGSRGAGLGTIPNGDEMTVNFTGLEPADSDTPAAIFDVIMNAAANDATIQNGGLLNGFQSIQVTDNNATFETTRFANKTTARIMGNSGADIFQVNYTIAAAGLTTLEVYGHLAPGTVGPVDDNASDGFALIATAAGVTTNNLFGQSGSDLFNNFGGLTPAGINNLDGVLSPVSIDGGSLADNDLIYLSDLFTAAPPDSTTLTSTTITGFAPMTITYTNTARVGLLFTPGNDTTDILSTNAGTAYELVGDGGNDVFTVGNTTANFNANVFTGTLANILGQVVVLPDGVLGVGTDTLNVDASADGALAGVASITNIGAQSFNTLPFTGANTTGPTTRLANFATANIDYFHGGTSGAFTDPANRLEFLNVRGSQGNDLINVNATTATNTTTLDGYLGNDFIAINGDNLSANNLFQGNDGNDDLAVNIPTNIGASGFAPIASVQIEGNGPGGDTVNRDRTTINDQSLASRFLNYQYLTQTSGDLDIEPVFGGSGLFGPADLDLRLRTTETVVFNAASSNDFVNVTGTTADDLLTVGLLNNDTSATVFLGGTPYLDAPPVTLANSRPGVAGGAFGPDLLIRGMAPGSGVFLSGGGILPGGGDRAVVYAASETALVDVGNPTNIFGFGAGVLLPGFGVGNAYDTISVTDTTVNTTNNVFGLLTPVLLDTASFVQGTPPSPTQQAALIVNGGDEAGFQATNIADNITATISANFNIQINGNLPTLTFAPPGPPDGEPQGDQLTISAPGGALNVFSDGSSPPNVTVASTSTGVFGILNSSIERLTLSASPSGIVNLIGDNNDPGVTQDDVFVVRGRDVDGNTEGVNEFQLQISGNKAGGAAALSNPIFFNNVTRINVSGGNTLGFDAFGNAIPETVGTGLDTLNITAYADNTPQGWGIETYFNEGDPVTDGDLVIYNGVAGVSDQIVIQPSDSQAGQIIDTIAGTSTTIAIVNYTLNTDIIVNGATDGSAGDTDTLTLRGVETAAANATGNETVVADFDAAGGPLTPMVVVTDSVNLNAIYTIQNVTNIGDITFDLGRGNDTMTLRTPLATTGYASGVENVVVQGGTGGDSLTVDVTGRTVSASTGVTFDGGSGADTFQATGTAALTGFLFETAYTPGPTAGAGTLALNDILATEAFAFSNTEQVIDTAAALFAVVNGNGSPNAITYGQDPTDPARAQVAVDGFAPYRFTDKLNLTLNGAGGNDAFVLNSFAPVGGVFTLTTLNVDGGAGTNSVQVIGTAANDTFSYTANSPTSAVLTQTATVSLAYNLNSVQSVSLDAQGLAADALTVPTAFAVIEPSATPGSGAVRPVDIGGDALLALSYSNLENVTVTGTTAVIEGTGANDTITVSATGLVTVTNPLGFSNSINVAGFNALVINALGGDDTINIASSGQFPGGIQVIGGEPGTGSDAVNISDPNPILDFLGDLISQVIAGVINLDGIEIVNFNGVDGVVEEYQIANYGAATDVRTLNLSGGDTNNNDNDRIDINTSALTSDTLRYTPMSRRTAMLTRVEGGPVVNISGFNDANGGLSVAGGAGGEDSVVIVGSASPDLFTVQRTSASQTLVNTLLAAGTGNDENGVPIDFANMESLVIEAGTGNDELHVVQGTAPNVLVELASGITFHGGSGIDALSFTGATTVAASYLGGPNPDEGTVVHVLGGVAQAVLFTGLEPIFDSVPGTLTVHGTNADNAINYRVGYSSLADFITDTINPNWGEVSIDGFEPFEFTNKTTLTINGRAGSDTINLDNLGTPTGLTGVTVDGGDPVGSDKLIVSGLFGGSTVNYAPVSSTSGTISVSALPLTTFTTIESVLYVGRGAADALTVTSPAGGAEITFTPGATQDSGTVTQEGFAAGQELTPLEFKELGINGTLTFATAGGVRSSGLDIHGTAADNTFDVDAAGGVLVRKSGIGGPVAPFINTPGVAILRLIGLDGDDTFNVPGNHPFPVGLNVQGGDPSASDVLNFAGSGGNVTVNFATHTVTEAGFPAVDFTGIETLNVNAGGADVTILGTLNDDHFDVTPDATAATTRLAFNNTTVNANSINLFTIDGVSGDDTLTVNATAAANTVDVTGTFVDITTPNRQRVDYLNIDALNVLGSTGNDVFNVTPSTAVSIFIDGGAPTGTGDSLNVTNTVAGVTTVFQGATADSGSINGPGGSVSFSGVDNARITGAAATDDITFRGTHDNDTIALQNLGGNNLVWINAQTVYAFSSFDGVTLNGLFGDDKFSVHPAALVGVTSITVAGGDPTASDELVVNGTAAADVVVVTPTGVDSGTVTGLGPTVTATGVEHLTFNGLGGNDTLTVVGPNSAEVELTPGVFEDAGSVAISTASLGPVQRMLPFDFLNLGGGGSLTFASAGGTRNQDLRIFGTDINDRFTVNPAGVVQVFKRGTGFFVTLPINTPGANDLFLEGLAGDDQFDVIGALPFTQTFIHGGDPSASDVVNLTGDGTAITESLNADGSATLTGGGLGVINLTGVEFLNLNANGGALTVLGNGLPDTLRYTPTGAAAGTVTRDGAALASNFTNVAGTFTVTGGGGSDTLVVNGTAAGETITVSGTQVTVGALKAVDFTAEALTVHGLQGSDTFDVTPSATVAMFIDGGDPIGGGATGDVLNVLAGGGSPTVNAGPENDEGSVVITGGNAGTVNFDHIESINIIGGVGPAIINGTNGPDAITIIARDASTHAGADGVQDFTVSVNDGVEILYLDTASIIVNSLGGSDEIAIQTPAPNLAVWDVDVTINGGLPTASDKVIVGTPGTDTILFTPTAADAGTLNIVNLSSTIVMTQIEHLVYDGEAGDDLITVTGTGDFVHTPGTTVDSGALQLNNFLALQYTNVGDAGTITASGTGADDSLTVLDTNTADRIDVDFTAADAVAVSIFSSYGIHIDVLSTGVENYVIDSAGNGFDDIFLNTPVNASGDFSVFGGGPSDELHLTADATVTTVTVSPDPGLADGFLITGFGTAIDGGDVSTISYEGNGADTLIVDLGDGDNVARVVRGIDADRITSDSLPGVEFTGLSAFEVDPGDGSDSVTFKTHDLAGALPGNYRFSSGSGDVLVIEGEDGATGGAADDYTVTNPAGAPIVAVVDNNAGVTVTATNGVLGRLQINTLGGDDTVTVDVNGTDLITVPITFDGGLGADSLTVSGTPTVAVTTTTYTPGPALGAGRLVYVGGGTMTVDFVGLEPVIDLVPAATLTVNGNGAANQITYSQGTVAGRGLVSVDAQETIEFSNKTTLILNGLAGNDTFTVDEPATTPTGLTTVNIVGGLGAADGFTLQGRAVDDAFTYTANAADGAQLGVNAITYNLSFIESAHVDALGALNDTLDVTTDNATIVPGETPTTGTVKPVDVAGRFLLPLSFTGMEDVEVTGIAAVIQGTAGNDTILITSAGLVVVTDMFGFTNSFDVSDFEAIVVNALGGDDTTTIEAGVEFPGTLVPVVRPGIRFLGGENGTGTDHVFVVGSGGVDNIVADLGTSTVAGVVAGPIVLDGVEDLDINGAGSADSILIDNLGLPTGVQRVTVDGSGGDAVFVDGTVFADVLNFNAFSATDGQVTRNGTVTTVTYSNLTGTLTVDGGPGGFDVLNVLGTEGADNFSATANSITNAATGGTVIVGLTIDRSDVYGFGSADNINLAAFNESLIQVFGGQGNDTVTGTLQADVLFGEQGNDILVGLAGNDSSFGGDGNDIFGNPSLVNNGVADDAGNDFFDGGAGSDSFVWEPGDGDDTIEGGAGDSDQLFFFGNAGAEQFFLFADGGTPARFHLFRVQAAIDIDAADLEEVNLSTLGGTDTVTVGRSDLGLLSDLSTTTVRVVDISLGADADADNVIVEGRPADENLLASVSGAFTRITGLGYDVRIDQNTIADRLTISGNEGDDVITVDPAVTTNMLATLNGNAGNDLLSATGILNGGDGNDTMLGGAGNDTMDGGAGDDTFMGNGGTDNVGGGAGASVGDRILVEGTSGADTISLAMNAGGLLLATVNGLTTTYANFIGGPIATSGIELIDVYGFAGADPLTVDSTNGAVPIAINFDGGPNGDLLTLTGGTATSDVYTPGPNPGQGTSSITIGGVTQLVTFINLEPVIDLVAGPLVINANNADNAINYTQGGVAANGLVSIDAQETIEFSNKTTLTINALAGSDTINLNNPTNPTGLTAITVNGGDPTAGSDLVIVNGTAALNAIVIDNLTASGAVVTGAQGSPVTLTGIEHLSVNGQGGNDTLNVITPAGGDVVSLTDGPLSDRASLDIRAFSGDARIPIDFTALGFAGTLTVSDAGGGRADELLVNASDPANLDAIFTVTAAGTITLTSPAFPTPTRELVDVLTPGVTTLRLNAFGGDDTFNLASNHPFTLGVIVIGAEPDGNDTLNITGGGAAQAVSIANRTVQETGFGAIQHSSIEILNLAATGANVTVSATTGDDDVSASPTGADAVTLVRSGTNTVFHFTGVGATFLVDLLGGSDELAVNGTEASQTINVNMVANVIDVVTLQAVTQANGESLVVNGLAGNDTFNVTPSAAYPIKIDGGDPIGSTAGDLLVLNPPGAFTVEVGPENDEGGLVSAGAERISWDKIEAVTVVGPGPGGIAGTNGDDDITIIARDNSTHAGTDGVQDFTVSVNTGPDILFINVPVFNVDALAGDDSVVVRAPAPNQAAWNVTLNLVGGPPAAGESPQGDRFELETPGTTAVIYTPTPGFTDRGVFVIDQAVDSIINLGGPLFPGASPGGFELTQYDGQVGNDTLTINTPVTANDLTTFQQTASDAGEFSFLSGGLNLLRLQVQNLGGLGTMNLVDAGGLGDRLAYRGTAGDDTFAVTTVAATSVTINAGIPLVTTGTELFGIDGNGGSDRMTFLGSNVAENYTFSNVDGKATLLRDVDAINIETTSVERMDVDMGAGADVAQINYLADTALLNLQVSLGVDVVADVVSVQGAPINDGLFITAGAGAGRVNVAGLTHSLTLLNTTTTDFGQVFGNGGDDTIQVDSLVPSLIHISVDGGPGNDVLSGPGDLIGGPGNNTIDMSRVASPIQFNMDLVGAGQAVGGVGVVVLGSIAQAVKGTQSSDVFFTTPNQTARFVDGVGGFDILNVDTLGGASLLTDNTLFANGSAPISFQNISRINFTGDTIVNVSPLVRGVEVQPLRKVMRRRNGRGPRRPVWIQRILFRNISQRLKINGPFYVVLEKLPPGLRVLNMIGNASRVSTTGAPVVRLNVLDGGNLGPGEVVGLEIEFVGTKQGLKALKQNAFSAVAYAGPGRI